MSGHIVKRTNVNDRDGFAWQVKLVRWDDGWVTAILDTPDDPGHFAYGEDGPQFRLADLRAAVTP